MNMDNLEGLFKNSEKIKQKKRSENIIEFENQAYISKKLVTLKNDVPLTNSISRKLP